MALYAIGDLHLSLGADKSMEVFGEAWQGYVGKIETALSALNEGDVLVLAGDTSWGLRPLRHPGLVFGRGGQGPRRENAQPGGFAAGDLPPGGGGAGEALLPPLPAPLSGL